MRLVRSKVALLLILLVILLGVADAKVVNVPGDYKDIKSAVENANAGDTILISPGIYYGSKNYSVRIDKPLTISGYGAKIESGYNYGFVVNSSNVLIEGIQFKGRAIKTESTLNISGLSIKDATSTEGDAIFLNGRIRDLEIENVNLNLSNTGVGILLDGYFENVTIMNGIIKDPYWAGIQLKRSNTDYYYRNVTIENVTVIGSNYDGIYANNVTDLFIRDSVISESGDDGIQAQGLKGCLIIEETTVSNSSDYGIYLKGSAELLFRNNSVSESANGLYAYQLTSAEIAGSIFYNNTNYNTKLSGVGASDVFYNTFANSTQSIVLSNTFARIHYNNLLNSTTAIANYQRLEINATYNYWGFCEENATLMADKIDSLIYDDDESGNGRVIFHPWLCFPVNVSLPVSFAKPDIVLENVTIYFSGILGDTLTVNAILRNAGGDSGAFKVALISNGTVLSEKSIPGLL